ncbi:MAG: preprotein translocase subunit YajC [Clostridia bacterium]|nr:preprotein translocase subunit YajC [Clostridia bacterium]
MNALFFLTDTAAGGGMGSMITMGLLLVVMIAMFWFTSRSNKKQEKQAQDMRDSLQVGDEITTIGGIIGKIVSIKEETLVLETSHDRTRIRILKTAVSRVDVKAEDAQN